MGAATARCSVCCPWLWRGHLVWDGHWPGEPGAARGYVPAWWRGWPGRLGGARHQLRIESSCPIPVEGQSQGAPCGPGGPVSLPGHGLGWLTSCLL